MSYEAPNPVKSVSMTFRIVEALMELDGAGVTELSEHIGVPKSTVHNYLSTLLQEEYVVKRGNAYEVGLKFLELGAYARHRQELFHNAKPEVDRLADETGELANLLVEEHGYGSYLYRTRGDQAVTVEAHMGTRVSLHTTALGKVLLAHLPDDTVGDIVERHGLEKATEQSIDSKAELEEELEEIRDRGVAFDDEERLNGLRCVAAPVLNEDDDVLGAVSVAGPTNRLQEERFREELPQKVLEVTNVIELDITYS